MLILGIETSCDETAAAVVRDGREILSNVVVSQIDIFAEYGGVIPEVAARSHLEVMMPVIDKALRDAQCSWNEIDAIAVTYAPGLLGSLLIGTLTARTLAILHEKPLYAVHHLKSHVYANWLSQIDEVAEMGVAEMGVAEMGLAEDSLGVRPAIPSPRVAGAYARAAALRDPSTIPLASPPSDRPTISPASPPSDRPTISPASPSSDFSTIPPADPSSDPSTTPPADLPSDCQTIPPASQSSISRTDFSAGSTPRLPEFPLLALVVSGGHTQILYMPAHNQFEIIGTTHDDAVGECFDKVAKILGLPYPGGPAISKAALDGDDSKYPLPHPNVAGLDFSFSGLKTAVLRSIQKELGLPISHPSYDLRNHLTARQVADFAASFQKTAVDILCEKMKKAYDEHPEAKSIVVAGGVSANQILRSRMREVFPDTPVFFPLPRFSGDNGAMVAAACFYEMKSGVKPTDPYRLNIYPRKPIG